MRRGIVGFLIVVVLGLVPTNADAHTTVCVGQGVFRTATPLYYDREDKYPIGFTFTSVIAGCDGLTSISASGSIHGLLDTADPNSYSGANCHEFHSVEGSSFANDGSLNTHHMEFTAIEGVMIVALTADGLHAETVPRMVGTMHLTPDISRGDSCVGGADDFLATFVLIPVTASIDCSPVCRG